MEQIDILSEQNVVGVGEEEELAPGQEDATNGDSAEVLNWDERGRQSRPGFQQKRLWSV